jgi:hypothetical protein
MSPARALGTALLALLATGCTTCHEQEGLTLEVGTLPAGWERDGDSAAGSPAVGLRVDGNVHVTADLCGAAWKPTICLHLAVPPGKRIKFASAEVRLVDPAKGTLKSTATLPQTEIVGADAPDHSMLSGLFSPTSKWQGHTLDVAGPFVVGYPAVTVRLPGITIEGRSYALPELHLATGRTKTCSRSVI